MGSDYWYELDSARTTDDGCFTIDALLPGRYYIKVKRLGIEMQRYPEFGSFKLPEGDKLNLGIVSLQ